MNMGCLSIYVFSFLSARFYSFFVEVFYLFDKLIPKYFIFLC